MIAELGFGEEDIDELASAGIKISRLLSCSPRWVKLEEFREIYGRSLYNG